MPKNPLGAKKQPPYFPREVLKFSASGHTLTKNRSYYVCAKGQKKQCESTDEKSVLRDTLEKSFSRLAVTLQIPESNHGEIIKRMLKEIFHFQIDYIMDHDDKNEVFNATLDKIRKDIELKKKRYWASDIATAKEAFLKHMKRNTLDVVCSMLIGGIMTYARDEATDTEMGRTLGYLSDQIMLSNTGEVEKIKLNAIGSYIYLYVKKRIPDFGKSIEQKIEHKNFERLDLKTLAETVKRGHFEDIIPHDPFETAYGMATMSHYLIGNIRNVKPENVLIALLIMENSAMINTMVNARRLLSRNY